MRDRKTHVEKKLRRSLGMSAEALEAMHKGNENLLWTARCWNCRQKTIAFKRDLHNCHHCGANLWERSQ